MQLAAAFVEADSDSSSNDSDKSSDISSHSSGKDVARLVARVFYRHRPSFAPRVFRRAAARRRRALRRAIGRHVRGLIVALPSDDDQAAASISVAYDLWPYSMRIVLSVRPSRTASAQAWHKHDPLFYLS